MIVRNASTPVLTPERARQHVRADGLDTVEIARRYNVSEAMVYRRLVESDRLRVVVVPSSEPRR